MADFTGGVVGSVERPEMGLEGIPLAGAEHPLRPLCAKWHSLIRKAKELKDEQFGDDAVEAMQFFNGPYDFLYRREYYSESPGFRFNPSQSDVDIPGPSFEMTVNVVSEMVQIFGPVLYHKNPHRQVNPREVPLPDVPILADPMNPMDPMLLQEQMLVQQGQRQRQTDEQRAKILEWYLNYTPTELDLKRESRRAIDEAIIKGCGVLWTELYQPKGTNIRLVGSFYDTIDNLIVDPDGESMEDAKWAARRRVAPCWEVERLFGLPEGTLKAYTRFESYTQQAEVETRPDADYDRKRGQSNDLLVYWEVYSKMGVGGRIPGMGAGVKQVLDRFGDFAYLVIADGVPFPLNLPPAVISTPGLEEEILERLEWPIPFWLDDEWPFTPIKFHEVPRNAWPMSHLKPGLGQVKFLNWAFSFLASKVRTTSRDFIAIRSIVSGEMKDRILHGKDLTLLEIEEAHPGSINEVVQFLQHPEINGDMFRVLELIRQSFERATGLTELIYGFSSKQMRSAEEAELKGEALQVRPEDMANKVEDAMSTVARKEAIAARWHLTADDVRPIMGDAGAMYWQRLVLTSDIYSLVRQMEYRIEAGSIRKPNQARDASNMRDAMQTLFMPLFSYAQETGDVRPLNALMTDWARSIGMDPNRYLLMAPPPPPAAPSGEEPGARGKTEQEQQAPGPQGAGGPPASAGGLVPPALSGVPPVAAPTPPMGGGMGVPAELLQQYVPAGMSLAQLLGGGVPPGLAA